MNGEVEEEAGMRDEGRAEDGVLEAELRRTMRRVAAPAGFAERVLARAAEDGRGRVVGWPVRRGWLGWAVAAGLLVSVGLGGGVWEHGRVEARRAAQARVARATAEFETAQAITDRTTEQIRMAITRAGGDPDDFVGVEGR